MGTMDLPTALRVHPLRALPEADIRALIRDDIRRMAEAFDAEVLRMTAARERFTFPRVPGPFAPGSDQDEVYQDYLFGLLPRRHLQAMIGNDVYKYLSGDKWAIPVGLVFDGLVEPLPRNRFQLPHH